MITLGGNAELELVDSMDHFSEVIIFSVMPPKKSWRNISNLSSGEKVRRTFDNQLHKLPILCSHSVLSPLYFLFMSTRYYIICRQFTASLTARFQPTPLYFMDEIDAALDFRNVSIVANYIKDRTKNAQFIIISLRFAILFDVH